MDKIKGKTMSEIVKEDYSKLDRVLRLYAIILANVHKCRDKENNLKSQHEYFQNLLLKLGNQDVKDRLIKMLDEMEDKDDICHTDTHMNNVMCDIDVSKRGIMIDWMGATRGNSLGNFAFALVFIESTPVLSGLESQTKMAIKKFKETYFNTLGKTCDEEELNKWRKIAAAALYVGNKEFRDEVEDEALIKRITTRLRKFEDIMS